MRTKMEDSMIMIANVDKKDAKRQVNYYLVDSNHERFYAFTRKFDRLSFELCKNGIRVNELLFMKTKQKNIMALVEYANRMMPYLADYYDLPVKKGRSVA